MGERFPEGPLTILFSDVEGSTDLRTERGDAAAHRILRSHEEVVRSCVAKHDGREVKALGDGFMVAFASARKALSCAVAIQQGLEERNQISPGDEVLVRIGINTGEVVVEGDDLYGQAVNAAARIATRAKGGEILVSEIVRQLVGSGPEFTFRDRGRCRLKGFPDRWHLSGLVYTSGEQADVVLFAERTPFVGREPERAELRRLLTQTLQGSGAVVMIGGEPGVGKTRLSEELMAKATREGLQTFVGHCYEMEGAQPYVPFVEGFEQALTRAPSPLAFRQFLGEEAAEVARLVPRLRQLCPDIPPPLELPPEQERRHLFNNVWEVMARTGRAQPAVFVLDDLHWADEPTMLLVQHLAERVADVPVLVVGLYRDSELDVGRPMSRTFEELIRRRLARRMTLKRLPEEAVAQMLAGLAGQEPPSRLVAVLYAEAEGNPFFTEEVFKHLAEEGRLFDADGVFRTDLSVDELDVPEGVRLVVGHRLRRLGEDGPKVLGSAAVIGRVFSFELLRVVEEMPEDPLLDLVEVAERVGLILSVDDGSHEDRFMFAHELIRQTVLGELSAPRRRRLHARTAEALERVYAADLGAQAAAIAHHLIEAGPAADPKRTFHYLAMAGEFAMESAAYEDALRHFERALSLKQLATPREMADLLFGLGQAQRSLGYWDQAMDSWREALDAYASLGEVEEEGRLCWELAWQMNWAARWAEAVEMAQRGLASLETRQSPARTDFSPSPGWRSVSGANTRPVRSASPPRSGWRKQWGTAWSRPEPCRWRPPSTGPTRSLARRLTRDSGQP
jgi:class 3 adenylate cyclase/tetratricopeptide (TPR) repeat protein